MVTAITALIEDVFKGLDMTREGGNVATTRSKRKEAQTCFEALHKMVTEKIMIVEDYIEVEVELCYQEFITNMKGVDLSRKNRQVNQGESSGNSVKPTSRIQFKP